MAQVKLTFDDCFATFPALHPPADLEKFWQEALGELKKVPLESRQKLVLTRSLGRESLMEVSFNGFGRKRLKGFLSIPRRRGKLPLVISFHDYHGRPDQYRIYTELGLAHLSIELRDHELPADPNQSLPALLEAGALDTLPKSYPYACFLDAVRCIDFARLQKDIDHTKIGLVGEGFGAAMALFAGFQKKENVTAIAMERPAFLWISRWMDESTSDLAAEMRNLVQRSRSKTKLKKNLEYLDILNISEQIRSQVLMIAGLEDQKNAPRPAFAFFNHMKTEKTMELFPEEDPENNPQKERKKSLDFLAACLQDHAPVEAVDP